MPANTFHFQGHGELREGNWADIVIFVPDKIQDNSTYLDPHHYATGIPYVLVNGIPVIKNGEHRREEPLQACLQPQDVGHCAGADQEHSGRRFIRHPDARLPGDSWAGCSIEHEERYE